MSFQGGGGYPPSRLNSPVMDDTTPHSHTGDTNEATIRTITVGGGFSGKRIVFLMINHQAGAAEGYIYLGLNDDVNRYLPYLVNSGSGASNVDVLYSSTTGRYYSTFLVVSNGDTIRIRGKTRDAGQSISVNEIVIFCEDVGVTFTGS